MPALRRCAPADRDIGKLELEKGRLKLHVGAIPSIGQNDTLRHAIGNGLADLIERDRRFGLEVDRLRNPCLGAPCRVACPVFWQIEPIIDRQARRLVRHRQADGDLAIVLLAQLTAILASNPNRVLALLRKAGVVDDPRLDRPMALDHRQQLPLNRGQQSPIGPVGLGHEVVQGLMRGAHLGRIDTRRNRLDALTFQRQQEPRRVLTKRRLTIGVTKRCRKPLRVGVKSLARCHLSLPKYRSSSDSYSKILRNYNNL